MRHSEVAFFVAYENGRPVGRVTAHIDHIFDEYYKLKQGFFGFFESIDSKDVAQGLMDASEQWIRAKGISSIMGPFNFSTNHEIGFLIKGFDQPPVIMMPYTQPYYPDLFYKMGYQKEKELIAYFLNDVKTIPESFTKLANRLTKRFGESVKIRNLDVKNFKSELNIILDIYNDAWLKNWGFVPMTDYEIDAIASQLRLFADTNFIYLLYKEDEPAAFLLALPDINQALIHVKNGKLFPTGVFKYLSAKRNIETGRILLMGVKSKYRKLGLDVLLYHQIFKDGLSQSTYSNIEMSWILEDNTNMINILDNLQAQPYKRYVIVKKSGLS